MNKQEYLSELEKALGAAHVQDTDEILEEYAEHFDMKKFDGYGEEEIAARLARPAEIARQFEEIKTSKSGKGIGKVFTAIGLCFTNLFVWPVFIMFFAWVIALGAFAVASLAAGVFTIASIQRITVRPGSVTLIPDMPFICSLFLGIALLAIAVLAAFGTEYCRMYAAQIVRTYSRWHGAVWGKNTVSPPLPAHPVMKPKKRRAMRNVTLIALLVLVVALVVGLASMMIAAGSLEPWHVWRWFE